MILFPALLLLVFLGCTACTPREIHQDQELIDLQVYQRETVYIGAVLPLTGTDQAFGEDCRAAMEVAVDLINNTHDIEWDLARSQGIAGYGNALVELVFEDCKSSNLSTATAADRALDLGVVAMVGAGRSDYTAELGRRCRLTDTAVVSGAANSPALTDGVTYTFSQWFNRIAPDPAMESQLFFAYIKHLNQTQNANIRTIAVAYQNTVHSLRALDVFYQYAEEAGLEVVASVEYDSDPADVTVETSRIVTAAPDAVAHIGGQSELALFVQGSVAAQYSPKVMLCYFGGYENQDLVDTVLELDVGYVVGLSITPERQPASIPEEEESTESGGTVTLTPNNSNKTETPVVITPLTKEEEDYNQIFAYINQLYEEKTGKPMTDEALLEFSSVIVLSQAIGQAGTTDRTKLQTTLKEGVFDAPYLESGSIDFNELGQNTVMCGYLTTIGQDGRFVQIFKP